MTDRIPTSFRLTKEDIEILEKLQKITGLESYTAVIRLSIREALQNREAKRTKK